MNITRLILLTALLVTPATAMAQTANPITAASKAQFDAVSGFVVRAAEKIPEDVYAFQPTAEVRTVAQLVGHIADGFMGMCSTAGGGKPPRTGIEKGVTGKANLVGALKEAVAYCQTVYGAMTDQRGLESVPFYFGPSPRSAVLYFTVAHAYEHYGNLVTYMRLKNIVPPSSEPPAKPAQ